MRTLAFIAGESFNMNDAKTNSKKSKFPRFNAETCVFAYLGLAIFSFHHRIEIALVIWSIILCLLGRALNIFPLGNLVNKFRTHRISVSQMFVMWFSGEFILVYFYS